MSDQHKLLIIIPTTKKYEGNENSSNRNEDERRQACRETWLKDCPVDYKFFYGHGTYSSLEKDEVVLDVPEGYDHLSDKYVAMTKWALDHNYTRQFRVDTDAYTYVDRLLQTDLGYDYSGFCLDYPKHIEWAKYASGAGWLMSERAMNIVANSVPDNQADDFWNGKILFQNGIKCVRDTRFLCGFEPHFIPLDKLPKEHPYTVLHALTPDGIREVHARGSAGPLGDAPAKPFLEPHYNFGYGVKQSDCPCEYCQKKG